MTEAAESFLIRCARTGSTGRARYIIETANNRIYAYNAEAAKEALQELDSAGAEYVIINKARQLIGTSDRFSDWIKAPRVLENYFNRREARKNEEV